MNKKKGKVKTSWVCESCGHSEGQWWGSCRACNKVGTMRRFSEGSSEFVSGGGDDDGKLMVGEISEVLRCLVTCMTSYDYALENFNSSC